MIVRDSFEGISFVLYLPDQFMNHGCLPLITLFRSCSEEWLNSREDTSRGRRNLITIVFDLVSKGYLLPCAFLLPDTCSLDRKQTWFTSAMLFPEKRGGNEPWLSQHIFETGLLPFLAQKFELDIQRISLDGFSLGGFTALDYGITNPQRYCSIGAFDPSLLIYERDNRRISTVYSDLMFDEFPWNYGEDPDEELFRSLNPLDRALTDPMPRNLFIMMSNDSSETSAKPSVEQFLNIMRERGIENGVENPLISIHSKHEWYWADEYLYRSLPFHARLLHQ